MARVSVGIDTTYNNAGAAQAQVAIGRVGQEATKAERQLLAYAQTTARLQVASGQGAAAQDTLRLALLQVERASQQALGAETQLLNIQKQVNRETSGGASLASQFGASLQSSMLSIIGPAAAAGAAIGAIKGSVELAQLGAQAELVGRRFDGLSEAAGTTGPALLAALRQASGGEISDLNLQLAANKAQLLGVADSADEFGVLMGIARDRAQQMGISTTQAFNDLVTGLGRGSALILDNLGITVSITEANETYAKSLGKTVAQLTEAEQKQALINTVLAQGKESLEATGGAVDGLSSKQARLAASFDNLKAKAGQLFAVMSEGAVTGASDLANGFDFTTESMAQAGVAASNFSRSLVGLPPLNAQLSSGLQSNIQEITAWLGFTSASDAAATSFGAAMDEERQAAAALSAELAINTTALSEDAVKKIDAAMASAELAAQQQQLTTDSVLAAQGLLGAGDQALLLAQKYGIAAGQAAFLIQQQQGLMNASALADQRVGERSGGKVNSVSELRGITTARDMAAKFERDQAKKTADEQKRIKDAQRGLDLANAKDNASKIAIYKRQLTGTTDTADRLGIQAQIAGLQTTREKGVSTTQRHTSALEKQAVVQEKIADDAERQQIAANEAALGSVRDQQARLKEAREAAGLSRFLAGGRGSAEQKAAVGLRLQEIGLEQQKRSLDIGKDVRAAGGVAPITGGPAAGVPVVAPPIGQGGNPFVGATPQGGGVVAGSQTVVNIALTIADGRVTSANAGGAMLNLILQGNQQALRSGGA